MTTRGICLLSSRVDHYDIRNLSQNDPAISNIFKMIKLCNQFAPAVILAPRYNPKSPSSRAIFRNAIVNPVYLLGDAIIRFLRESNGTVKSVTQQDDRVLNMTVFIIGFMLRCDPALC
mmetsp:Transcript_20030/g.28198  ORF Transcript_20030/g.28198 Transcript_20030/m.28198 type:complete len:118 (+) Transcript_20030:71-424(+)